MALSPKPALSSKPAVPSKPAPTPSRRVLAAATDRGRLALGLLVAGLAAAASAAPASATDACRDGSARLCLLGRYAVEVTWRDGGGRDRAALALPLATSRAGSVSTGAFSFFGHEDTDLLVRVTGRRRPGGPPGIEAIATAGVGFELRVLDTANGEEWVQRRGRGEGTAIHQASTLATANAGSHGPPAEHPAEVDTAAWRLVADVLEAGIGESDAVGSAASAAGCRASATDLCFLNGRFRVTARIAAGPRQPPGPAIAGSCSTGLFAVAGGDAADLVVRVLDGRAVNGHVWLTYATLASTAVELELTDLATGNSRRFVAPAGGPASAAVTEALSASATVVNVTLDSPRAVRKTLGPLGGFLEATDGRGSRFRLVLPKNALSATVEVKLTPVATIAALPFSGGLAAAAYLEPAGLVMSESALLTITPGPALPRAQQLTFTFRGLAGELSLVPPRPSPTGLIIPVQRLRGYGVGAGTAADLTAQLGQLPTGADDRFSQRLAGLLLPPHRAGSTAPLPASVLLLLQSDFTTRIKPKLATMKAGGLVQTYVSVRRWRSSALDAGLGSRLGSQLAEIKSAELTGAKKSYETAAKSDEKAAAPCRNFEAARRMYLAYAALRANGAQSQVRTDRLLLCARFELRWDTTLESILPQSLETLDEAEVKVPLQLNVAGGYFAGARQVNLTKTKVDGEEKCNIFFSISRTGGDVQSSLRVKKLFVSAFGWYDDFEPLRTTSEIIYGFEPPSLVNWLYTCESHYPPAPRLPRTTAPFNASWTGLYTLLHIGEVDRAEGGFRVTLQSSADSRIFAQKGYLGGAPPFKEDSLLQLFFGSAPQ